MEINKFEDVLDLQVHAERLYGWCHKDNVIIEILIELLDVYSLGWTSGDQLEFKSVVLATHISDMIEEDTVSLQGCPSIHKHQCTVL